MAGVNLREELEQLMLRTDDDIQNGEVFVVSDVGDESLNLHTREYVTSYLDKTAPAHKYKKSDSSKGETEEECSVCLGKYETDEEIRRIPCNHTFHKECIEKWILQKNSCPMCRQTVILGRQDGGGAYYIFVQPNGNMRFVRIHE